MATGLDVAAGIAGLITLADVVIDRTCRTIRACKNAGKDSQRLLREVQLLLGILNGLKTMAGQLPKNSIQALISHDLVQDCQHTLTGVKDKLIKADPDENGISKATRILRILKWPITEPETQKIMQDLERYKTSFDLSVSIDSLQNIMEARTSQAYIARGVEDVRKALSDITRIQLNAERERVLRFFGTFEMEETHGKNTQLRHPGTGLWLTKGPEFTGWLQSRNSKQWMFGIPGAGKTVLAAAAIEETMQYASAEYGIAYYYCDYKVPDSQRLQKMFACLAGQLGRQSQDCFDELASLHQPDPDQSPRSSLPSEADLQKLLEKLIAHFDDVSIIIDGVEECFDPSNVAIALSDLVSKCAALRLLVASRDEQTIRPHFTDFEKLSIAAKNDDLRLYVSAEIEERSKRGRLRIKSTALKDEILDKLINGADGMFRWVACQMDTLAALPSDAARRKALQQLPPDLYTTYDRILERVRRSGEDNCVLVERTLHWLFSGGLRSELLLEAVSVEGDSESIDPESQPDEEAVLIACSSLVRAGVEDSLELAHFTVKEYLSSARIRDDPQLSRFHCDKTGVNEYKALTCLRYMCFPQFAMAEIQQLEQYRQLSKDWPFYTFASWRFDSFVLHSNNSTAVLNLALRFFCSLPLNFTTFRYTFCAQEYTNSGFTEWDNNVYARLKGIATFAKPQHIAAMLALDSLLGRLLSDDYMYDPNERCPLGTPLHCALGGTELLSLIFERRQKIVWDQQAADDDHVGKTIRVLLDHGADVNEAFLLENICDLDSSCTPACFSCRNTNVNLTRMLFDAGAQLNRHTLRGMFQCNFEKDIDKKELVGILVTKSIAEDDRGLLEVLKSKFRLSNGSDTNFDVSSSPLRRQGLTASDVEKCFRWSCVNDDLEMLDSLIAVDSTNLDKILANPSHGCLHIASYRGSSRVVKRLLDYGVSANAIDGQGATPIHTALFVEASRSGIYKNLEHILSKDLVKALIDSGADVKQLDQNSASCLHGWAAIKSKDENKCKDVLDMLLSHGADVMLQDTTGETMLHSAALYDARQRIQELRSSIGTDKFDELKVLADNRGAMPVHIASRGGCVEALKLLREFHPVNGQLTDDGRNEISYAAQGSGWDTHALRFLLESGLDASSPSKDGSTPVHYCVQGLASLHDSNPENRAHTAVMSFEAAIGMLESHGCDVTHARKDGTTALHLLSHVVSQKGFHPNAQSCKFCKVFCESMDVLLDRVTDFSAKDAEGRTALVILLGGTFRTYDNSYDIAEINYAAMAALYRVLLRCQPDDIKDLKYRGMSVLGIAALLHHEDMILRLLELNADVDSQDTYDTGWTPMQLLCRQGCSPKVVELALKKTSSIKQRSTKGETLLHLATSTRGRKSHADVLKALVRAGLDVNARSDMSAETALMSSACTGSIDEMEVLLAAGANVNIEDDTGGPSLAKACWGGHLPAVRLLLDSGAKIDFSSKRYFSGDTHQDVFGSAPLFAGPLHLAAEAGNTELLRVLLKSSDTPVEDDAKACDKASPLWWAAYFGHIEAVRLLVQHGFDPDATDPIEHLSPLHLCVVFNQLSVMHALLEAGCNDTALDRLQRSPMDHAKAYGNLAAIQILSSHQSKHLRVPSADVPIKPASPLRSPISKTGQSPLYIMEVIDKGELDTVRRLCESGVDFNLPFDCGCRPLLEAMTLGKIDIASYLIEQKVSIAGVTCANHSKEPWTVPQAIAKRPNALSLLRKLLDGHENDIAKQRLAQEMLLTASIHGNITAIKELCTRGHIPDKSRKLLVRSHPLLEAIRCDREEAALVLLDAGIDFNFLERDLVSALHYAANVDMEDVVVKLLELGASVNAMDKDLRTPAMWAAWAGREEIVDILLKHGAHLGLQDKNTPSVITEAIRGGYLTLARHLVNKHCHSQRAVVDTIRYLPIGVTAPMAAKTFVLNLGIDLNIEQYLFDVGFAKSSLWRRRVIRLLPTEALFRNLTCQRETHACKDWHTPLHYMTVRGDHRGVVRLLKAGAPLNMESSGAHGTPLMAACRFGRLSIVKALVRRGAILHYARRDGTEFKCLEQAASYPDVIRWILVERYTEQKKLESSAAESTSDVPEMALNGTYAPATTIGVVPWDATEFIAAENATRFIQDKLASFQIGPFVCREDGYTQIVKAGDQSLPWS